MSLKIEIKNEALKVENARHLNENELSNYIDFLSSHNNIENDYIKNHIEDCFCCKKRIVYIIDTLEKIN